MRNEDILAHWRTQTESTTLFAEQALLAYDFLPATRAFLVQVGLPVQAAPFLSLSQHATPTRGGFYQVQQQYDLADFFARYIAIGSDGAGNPIVINIQQQDRIEWLDHEDGFAPYYVNASVQAPWCMTSLSSKCSKQDEKMRISMPSLPIANLRCCAMGY